MKKIATMSLLALMLGGAHLAHARPDRPPVRHNAKIQIAILLDTSNSMDGLIRQAKSQLWKVVSELNRCSENGAVPQLEVALYEYGNDGLSVLNNYIRQVVPFTQDLDRVSEELFRLKTNGGEEYCGAVIQDSLRHLEWSKSDGDLKTIFIAGNEPFSQGGVPYQESCARARTRGVVVNTVYCGSRAAGIRELWQDGAERGDGRYLVIDQDRQSAEVSTPYDVEIIDLGVKINRTYIRYGPQGQQGENRQRAQDSANASLGAGVMADRAAAKASSNYNNEGWDLVDARSHKKAMMRSIPAASLPSEMQAMTPPERERYVDTKAKEREQIQQQINLLETRRRAYLTHHRTVGGEDSLDIAMVRAVREEAVKKGFHFKP
jgi:hypothetical protein